MERAQKTEQVGAIKDRFERMSSAVFLDFSGMNVAEVSDLRAKFKEKGVEYKVVKNTLVRLAIGDNLKLRASDIEFGLPHPSYTVDTLAYLKEKYPSRQFVLIMGGDNLATLHKWKNYEILLRDYEIYVYNRPGYELGPFASHPNVRAFDAPQMHISASYIRECIREGYSVQYLVPDVVHEYLEKSGLYRE